MVEKKGAGHDDPYVFMVSLRNVSGHGLSCYSQCGSAGP
jgi:hypothetical protein